MLSDAPGLPVVTDPVEQARHENLVRRRFWRKVRRTVSALPFAGDLLGAYYCAVDPATPRQVRIVLMAALAYFVVPTDLIPDFIAGLGYTDDATVLLAALRSVRRHVTPDHRDRARRALTDPERN